MPQKKVTYKRILELSESIYCGVENHITGEDELTRKEIIAAVAYMMITVLGTDGFVGTLPKVEDYKSGPLFPDRPQKTRKFLPVDLVVFGKSGTLPGK